VTEHELLKDQLAQYMRDPGALQDPYPLLAEARQLGPAVEVWPGFWVVTGFDAATSVLQSDTISRAALTEKEVEVIAGGTENGQQAGALFARWFLNEDPPKHSQLRVLVSPAFRPRIISDYNHWVDVIATQLIERLIDLKEADFLREFARPLVHQVTCRIFGIPPEDEPIFLSWINAILEGNRADLHDHDLKDLRDGLIGMGGYLRDLVRSRYDNPGDGLIGSLITSEAAQQKMSEDELVSTLQLLIAASHETTVQLLTNGLYTMLRFGQPWNDLRAEPALLPRALEECLRYEPPGRARPRMAIAPTVVEGIVIPQGAVAQVHLGAANRDPKRFVDPDVFDITRDVANLAFGSGVHFCMGIHVAKLEGRLAFQQLSQKLDIELAGDVRWRHTTHRALEALPVAVTAR
jgi:cytochrome P450